MAVLLHTDPLGRRHRCVLDTDSCVLGRENSDFADVFLSGDDVSRRHARVFRVHEDWFLEDTHSRNHTYLNGRRIPKAIPEPLRHGSEFTICRHRFLFLEHDTKDLGCVQWIPDSNSSGVQPSSILSLSDLSDSSQSREATRRLSLLIRITRSLQHALLTSEILDAALEGLFRIIPSADRGMIGFLDADGRFQPQWSRFRSDSGSGRIDVSQTVVRQVLEKRDAVLYDGDVLALPDSESLHLMPARCVICAPLIDADDRVFGMLQLDSATRGGFAPADLELVAAVAVQLSLAIHLARLHEAALRRQALERDVEHAREVQRTFLPQKPPVVPGYEFGWYYEPAQSVGGDLFDFTELPDGRLAMTLADVEGKGIPAALYMARLASEIRAALEWLDSPTDVVARLNARLQEKYVTLVLAVLDPVEHRLTVVNAGHRAPFIRHRDGSLSRVGEDTKGFPFCVSPVTRYDAETRVLEPGESLIVFSDGFEDAECSEADGRRFGIARVQCVLEQADPRDDAVTLTNGLVDSVRRFTGDASQFDDMCLVIVRRHAADISEAAE